MERQQLEGLAELQQTAQQLLGSVQTALADPQQFYRCVYGGKDQPPEETVLRKADTRAIKEMAAALKEMTAVARNLQALALEAAKKQAPDREDAAGEYGVVLLG